MFKAMYRQVSYGGDSRGSVQSSLARHGVSCRGLALHRTALSCPVRYRKALQAKAFRAVAWYGGAGSGPAGSSGVWFSKLRQGISRRGPAAVGRCTLERCFVSYGKLRHFVAWFSDVLFGVVELIGVMHSKVRFYCGLAWKDGVGKSELGPCVARLSKALFWQGGVEQSEAHIAELSLMSGMARHGTVGSGFARLRAAGQGLLKYYLGLVLPCEVGRSVVKQGQVLFGLGQARRGPVRQGPAKSGFASLTIHGYGGYQN